MDEKKKQRKSKEKKSLFCFALLCNLLAKTNRAYVQNMADAAVETAPGDENDDSWLYGDGAEQSSDKPPEEGVKTAESEAATGAPVSYRKIYANQSK